jgi:hypothetical protein
MRKRLAWRDRRNIRRLTPKAALEAEIDVLKNPVVCDAAQTATRLRHIVNVSKVFYLLTGAPLQSHRMVIATRVFDIRCLILLGEK